MPFSPLVSGGKVTEAYRFSAPAACWRRDTDMVDDVVLCLYQACLCYYCKWLIIKRLYSSCFNFILYLPLYACLYVVIVGPLRCNRLAFTA